MYKICRTESSLQRQRALENGLLEYMDSVLFFDMEIADLCRYLNIPRKTFYRYFGSKEDALYALVDHRLRDLDLIVRDSYDRFPGDSRAHSLAYFRYWKEQQRFLDIISRNYLVNVLMRRAVLPENAPTYLLISSALEKDSPNSYLCNFWISGALSMVLQWHASGYQKSVQDMADIAMLIFKSSPIPLV